MSTSCNCMVLAPSVDTHPKDGVDPYQKPTPERIASALIFFFVIISHLDKLFSNLYVMMLQGQNFYKWFCLSILGQSSNLSKNYKKNIILTTKSFTLILDYWPPLTLKIDQMPTRTGYLLSFKKCPKTIHARFQPPPRPLLPKWAMAKCMQVYQKTCL